MNTGFTRIDAFTAPLRATSLGLANDAALLRGLLLLLRPART